MKTYAGCEGSAYQSIGLQTDDEASPEYLQKKGELIRICMVQNGYTYTFKGVGDENSRGLFHDTEKDIYKRHGVWEAHPGDPQYADAFKLANAEIDKWVALYSISAGWWE